MVVLPLFRLDWVGGRECRREDRVGEECNSGEVEDVRGALASEMPSMEDIKRIIEEPLYSQALAE